MAQAAFFLILYFLGTGFALLFKRTLPTVFLFLSGFFWGILGFVILSLVLLILGISYSSISMVIAGGCALVILIFAHIRLQTWKLSQFDWLWFLGTALVFSIAVLILAMLVPMTFTPDSFALIRIGRWIGNSGFYAVEANNGYGVVSGIADFGVFVPIVQSAAVLLKTDYLTMLNPLLVLSMTGCFVFFGQRRLSEIFPHSIFRFIAPILFSLVFLVDPLFFKQTFYLHTNMVSTVFLFLTVVCFWEATREVSNSWLIFGFLALTAFALTRTEGPLFALVPLVLIITYGSKFEANLKTAILFFSMLMAGWYFWLSFNLTNPETILTPLTSRIIAGSLLAISLYAFLVDMKFIKEKILPYIPIVMVAGFFVICVGLFILYPTHMITSVSNIFQNLFMGSGLWGFTWYILVGLAVLTALNKRITGEGFFSATAASLVLIVIILGSQRIPYRLGWTDSANRMMTHIIPLIFYFFLLKFFYRVPADRH